MFIRKDKSFFRMKQSPFPDSAVSSELQMPLHIHCSIIFTFVSKIEYEWTEHSCEVWGLP
ncbi:hypothetical protein A343_0907 [Porphyromonas gingivalis JCVI SC001]|nr:hypothetical protein A343_0907 [Porphyromonas gingivalis JCVI SC001]